MRKLHKKIISLALAALCCLVLTGCAKKVTFASGEKFAVDETGLSLVIAEGESSLLDEFTALESLDLSGSLCYAEILAWAKAHPEVDVRYTVALPGDILVDSSEESVDLSSLEPKQYSEAFQFFEYLPALRHVKLGSAPLSVRELAGFSSRYPDINFECSFKLFGSSFSSSEKSMDLTGLDAATAKDFISVLPAMYMLETVTLGSSKTSPELVWSDIEAMLTARSEAEFVYEFSYLGLNFSTTDTSMDLRGRAIYDGGEEIKQMLRCMPKLKYLDMDSCGVKSEQMAEIRDEFPNVEVVWRIWFGRTYSVRTDVETILASRPTVGGDLTPYNTQELKYCTKVKYLDVGHNQTMTDISFISYMPELEVAILAISGWGDTSPIADCPKLEYLEIQTTKASDLSPLANLTELKHLNICYLFELTDISPLYSLTKLERLWIGCLSPVPEEQVQTMQQIVPDCEIDTTVYDPTSGNWRYVSGPDETGTLGRHPRYALLLEQFGYTDADFSFCWNDPLFPGW